MSAKPEHGGSAFPAMARWDDGVYRYVNDGMSLRDYFAAHAPASALDINDWSVQDCQNFLGLPDGEPYQWRKHYTGLQAKLAYEYADAMVKARVQ